MQFPLPLWIYFTFTDFSIVKVNNDCLKVVRMQVNN